MTPPVSPSLPTGNASGVKVIRATPGAARTRTFASPFRSGRQSATPEAPEKPAVDVLEELETLDAGGPDAPQAAARVASAVSAAESKAAHRSAPRTRKVVAAAPVAPVAPVEDELDAYDDLDEDPVLPAKGFKLSLEDMADAMLAGDSMMDFGAEFGSEFGSAAGSGSAFGSGSGRGAAADEDELDLDTDLELDEDEEDFDLDALEAQLEAAAAAGASKAAAARSQRGAPVAARAAEPAPRAAAVAPAKPVVVELDEDDEATQAALEAELEALEDLALDEELAALDALESMGELDGMVGDEFAHPLSPGKGLPSLKGSAPVAPSPTAAPATQSAPLAKQEAVAKQEAATAETAQPSAVEHSPEAAAAPEAAPALAAAPRRAPAVSEADAALHARGAQAADWLLNRVGRGLSSTLDGMRRELARLDPAHRLVPEAEGNVVATHQRAAATLLKHGFTLDKRQPSVKTSFSVTLGPGAPGPVAVFVIEESGNLAEASDAGAVLGAATALASVAPGLGLTVRVLGVPTGIKGGVGALLDEGFFDGATLAICANVGNEDGVGVQAPGDRRWDISFAAPKVVGLAEVDARDAVSLARSAVSLAQSRLPSGVTVDLSDAPGSAASSAARASLLLGVSATAEVELEAATERVLACFEGAGMAAGARFKATSLDGPNAGLRQDAVLVGAYRACTIQRGRVVPLVSGARSSSGIARLSRKVPTLQPTIGHEPDGSSTQAVLDAAFGLALAAASGCLAGTAA